jgi:hypothetical protein
MLALDHRPDVDAGHRDGERQLDRKLVPWPVGGDDRAGEPCRQLGTTAPVMP